MSSMRNPETGCVPNLSPEAAEWVVEVAKEEIETIDGVDYLRGHRLPADDDRIFDPVVHSMAVTILGENPRVETERYPARDTNRMAREANIKAIALIGRPTYLTWDDLSKALLANQARLIT